MRISDPSSLPVRRLNQELRHRLVCHVGDGNAHSLLLFRNDEELEKVKGIVHRMVERAQELDGTASGEHGVGIGKLEYMEGELGAGTVDLLRSIKNMVDPQNIMVSLLLLVAVCRYYADISLDDRTRAS